MATHILGARNLRWLEETPDTPSAILSETGGPGDDFGIEFVDSSVLVEAQAKHGLSAGTRFWDAIRLFADRWKLTPNALGVLVVDKDSSKNIRLNLRRDLKRLRQQRSDKQSKITRQVLEKLGERTKQLYVVEVDLDTDSSHGLGYAIEILRDRMVDSGQAAAAWSVLVAEGLEQAKDRGRRDKSSLEGLLSKQQLLPKALRGTYPTHRLPPGALGLPDHPVSSSTQTSREDVVLEEVNSQLKAGRPRVGLKILKQLDDKEVAARPVRTRVLWASCLLASGDAAAAIKELREATDYGSDTVLVMSNLAQALLVGGEVDEAMALARQTLDIESGNRLAWLVLLQADTAADITALPQELSDDQDIWRARAMAALRRGDSDEGLECAMAALRSGPRSTDALLVYIRALLAKSESEPDTSKHAALMEGLRRVSEEALDAVDDDERPHTVEDLLLASAVSNLSLGDDSQALEQLRRARRLPEHSVRPTMLLSRVLRDAGQSAEALVLVDEDLADNPTPELRLVRAGLLVALNRQPDAATELESFPYDETVIAQLPLLLEGAIDAGLTSFADTVLDDRGAELPQHVASVFRARIRKLDRELDEAERFYENALRNSPDRDKSGISGEFAQLLVERRKYQRCCDVLEQFDGLRRPELASVYTRCLLLTGRLQDAQAFIDGLAERRDEPWALRSRANIAIAVGDSAAAVSALHQLRQLDPSDTNVALNLAVGLVQTGDHSAARTLLADLVEVVESGDDLARLSSLFGVIGDQASAVRAAFRAVRRDPDNPQIQVFYLGCFAGRSDAALDLNPSKVGADCWVQIRDVKRSEYNEEYLILSEGPVSAAAREFLVGESAVADLVGQSIGDRITRASGPGSTRELEVVDIKHAFVHLFQQTISLYPNRFPRSDAVQVFSIDDTPGGFSDLIALAEASREWANQLADLYRRSALPLGVLALKSGHSARDIQLAFTMSSEHVLLVQKSSHYAIEKARAVAQSDFPTAITASALVTLQQLSLLDDFAAAGRKLLAPSSLGEELDAWLRVARSQLEMAGDLSNMGIDAFGLPRLNTPERSELAGEVAQIEALKDWLHRHCDVRPVKPANYTSAKDKVIEAAGRSGWHAVLLARENSGCVYADDLGLSILAEEKAGVMTFSTDAWLRAMEDTGTLDAIRVVKMRAQLLKFGHKHLSVSGVSIMTLLRGNGFEVDDDAQAFLDHLADPATETLSAIAVVAELVREVSLSTVSDISLRSLTLLFFECLSRHRPPDTVSEILELMLRPAFALLPHKLEIALSAVRDGLRVRHEGGRPGSLLWTPGSE